MADKKAKRPALRYLLSADPGLRKLSMKKLAGDRKKPAAPKRAVRGKAAPRRDVEPSRRLWTTSPRAMGLTAVGVLAAATLFAAGQISDGTESGATAAGAPVSEPRLVAVPSPSVPPRAETPATPARPLAPEPVKRTATKPAAVVPVPAAPSVEQANQEVVTITGCLVKSGEGFSLKNASGDAVGKTRSWRSGFFKKSPPRVDVVAAPGVPLAGFVGQRVSATGVLTERVLRTRSMRRIGAECE